MAWVAGAERRDTPPAAARLAGGFATNTRNRLIGPGGALPDLTVGRRTLGWLRQHTAPAERP
jgi:hypothetical protein